MNYTPNEPPRTLTAAEIEKILPHRYPFALVDKILDYTPGQWARGIKCVTRTESFFPGHLPGHPGMPGVLFLEAHAQTGAVGAVSLPAKPWKDCPVWRGKKCPFPPPGCARRCADFGM